MAKPGEEVSQPRGGGWGKKNLNAVLPSRWQMLQKYLFRGSFILFENHVGIM